MRHSHLLDDTIERTDEQAERERIEYGVVLITILRILRKSPLLVDKINEAQAVDCFNELEFLHEPWLDFPVKEIAGYTCPDEKMHLLTFDQFIYALKEYYLLLESKDVTKDMKQLARLVATLYARQFDATKVEHDAEVMIKKAKPWQLLSVLYAFTNIFEYITTQRCKVLFGKGGKGTEHPLAIWLKIKYRLGESGYFQGKEAVEKARIYEALDYLCELQTRKESAGAKT